MGRWVFWKTHHEGGLDAILKGGGVTKERSYDARDATCAILPLIHLGS